jgi:hypothetical protein
MRHTQLRNPRKSTCFSELFSWHHFAIRVPRTASSSIGWCVPWHLWGSCRQLDDHICSLQIHQQRYIEFSTALILVEVTPFLTFTLSTTGAWGARHYFIFSMQFIQYFGVIIAHPRRKRPHATRRTSNTCSNPMTTRSTPNWLPTTDCNGTGFPPCFNLNKSPPPPNSPIKLAAVTSCMSIEGQRQHAARSSGPTNPVVFSTAS